MVCKYAAKTTVQTFMQRDRSMYIKRLCSRLTALWRFISFYYYYYYYYKANRSVIVCDTFNAVWIINVPKNQLAVSQVTDWTIRGLVKSPVNYVS